ncbi:MAG: MATE family efflux transporter [Clostridiales bacterium]|nr:MATE family efflux transporter [Clostridiales bacterium]
MNDTFMKEKPVFPLLISMALPMVLSMLVSSLYNIVDSYFVAAISEDAITALSLVYPVQNFISAVSIGFGVGINAVIVGHLGAGNQEKANAAATLGIIFSAAHGLMFTAAGIGLMPEFLRHFTANETVLRYGIQYSRIAFSFTLYYMLSLAWEKIFQAVGRMKTTMICLGGGCLANIILDPILIFGVGFFPTMGVRGAALATGLGQLFSLILYLIFDHISPLPVRINPQSLKAARGITDRLYGVGIPATLNLALPSFLVSFLNALLAPYTQGYVLILGIYYKLQSFLYLPANGIIQGMRPIIGYNYGAGERLRVRRIYLLTLALNGGIMLLGTILALCCAEPIICLFTTNPGTIAIGRTALRTICIGFLASAVSVTSCGALEGIGKGTQSLVISLCRYIVVIIPVAWILSRITGPHGIWHAFWITEIITAVVAAAVYRHTVRS